MISNSDSLTNVFNCTDQADALIIAPKNGSARYSGQLDKQLLGKWALILGIATRPRAPRPAPSPLPRPARDRATAGYSGTPGSFPAPGGGLRRARP